MANSNKLYIKDIIVSSVLIVLCTATLLYSLTFPESHKSVGVSTFPRILAILIILLSGIQIITSIVRKSDEIAKPFHIPKHTLILIGICLVLLIAYITIISYLGFVLSTVLFQAGLIYSLGERKTGKIAIISVAVTAIIYLLFHVVARVPFPQGIIENIFN